MAPCGVGIRVFWRHASCEYAYHAQTCMQGLYLAYHYDIQVVVVHDSVYHLAHTSQAAWPLIDVDLHTLKLTAVAGLGRPLNLDKT